MNAVNAFKRNTDSEKQQILETQHHTDHRQTEQLSKLSTLRQHLNEKLDSPLIRIFNDRDLHDIKNRRVLNFIERNQCSLYRYRIIAIPGKDNVGANTMSRKLQLHCPPKKKILNSQSLQQQYSNSTNLRTYQTSHMRKFEQLAVLMTSASPSSTL